MRKRNCRVEVRFTKDELSALTKKARKAHLSNGAFIRKSVAGTEIKEAPPADFPDLIKLMRSIESKLNDLLQIEKHKGGKDTDEIQSLLEEIRKMDSLIWTAFT